jgi:hypothetical protein
MNRNDTTVHRRRRLLRLLTTSTAAFATTVAAVIGAPAATAGQPVTNSGDGLNVGCDGVAGAAGVQLAVDDNDGAFQVLAVVYDKDGSTLLYNPERTGQLTREGDMFTGTLPLLDGQDNYVGEGRFSVTVAESGPATTRDDQHRTGNVRVTTMLTEQPLTGQATLSLPDGTAAALDCAGQSVSWAFTATQPDAYAERGPRITTIECIVPLPEGDTTVVQVEQASEGGYVAVSVFDESDGFGGDTGDFSITRTSVRANVPMYQRGAEESFGAARVELTLSSLERSRFVLSHSAGKEIFFLEAIRAAGSVTLPDGRLVALDCNGERSVSQKVTTAPSGPDSTGPSPGNDAPAGAVALAPGGRHSTQTRSADPAPELPLWCYDEPPHDPGYLPGRTVWYRFTGTGAPVTVDTAGSGFNTMLAVYAVDGDTYTEVACADDHWRETWQAHATLDTQRGVEYLVQVGGVGGQSGILKVALHRDGPRQRR